MDLTPAQLTTFKTDPTSGLNFNTSTVAVAGVLTQIKDVNKIADLAPVVAEWYNAERSPAYFVWRTGLGLHELVEEAGVADDGTTVTAFVIGGASGGYINRSDGERDAFIRLLFNSTLTARPHLANVRTAVDDIFSGAGAGAQANRAHWRAKGRRTVLRGEFLFVVQTVGGPTQSGNRGTRTNPDTLGAEGQITPQNVIDAWKP